MKAIFATAGIWISLVGFVAAQPTDEQLNQAQAVVTQGERLSSRVTGMKGQAQREKDIIRVNCLNKSLAEVNANLNTAESRFERLGAEEDPKRITQAMTVMVVLGQKFKLLDQQANQCIGENVFDTGTTKVDTKIDKKTVPSDEEVDPTLVPEVAPSDVDQPQVLTPPDPKEVSPNGDEG